MKIENKPAFLECQICFKHFLFLNFSHLWFKHGLTVVEYIKEFDIPHGGTVSKSVAEKMSLRMKRMKVNKNLLAPMDSFRARQISPLFKMNKLKRKQFCKRASRIGLESSLKHCYSKTPAERHSQAVYANKLRWKGKTPEEKSQMAIEMNKIRWGVIHAPQTPTTLKKPKRI